MGSCKQFTPDFKREPCSCSRVGAVRVSEITRELGVHRNQLYNSQTELGARGEVRLCNPTSGKCEMVNIVWIFSEGPMPGDIKRAYS